MNKWSTKRVLSSLVAAAMLTLAAGAAAIAAETPAGFPKDKVTIEMNVMVPMRDGVKLATDIYRPAGDGKYPVVLSRIPYGTRIEPAILRRLDEAESVLKEMGFRQVRVRHHGDIARIEVEPGPIAARTDAEGLALLKQLGMPFRP